MKFAHKSTLIVMATMAAMTAGCHRDTPSNELGQKVDPALVDQAVNDMKKNADKAGTAIADSAITAKVKAAIIAEAGLGALDVKVDTVNGAVTLKGTIDTPKKIEQASQVAQGIDGVKSVSNQLSVKTSG